jgi:Rrf2 family transcriptional regulator, nitric oxide-sensitive transcriptional repressor
VRLTAFTDYSLRMLIYLAAAPEGRATVPEVARAFGISTHHLVKVAHGLGKHGILTNTRGRGGGLKLALPADRINVGRVVRITEGEARPAECFEPGGSHCLLAGSCNLEGVLREAVVRFYSVLDQYSLADLVTHRQQLAKIMMWHAPVAA